MEKRQNFHLNRFQLVGKKQNEKKKTFLKVCTWKEAPKIQGQISSKYSGLLKIWE